MTNIYKFGLKLIPFAPTSNLFSLEAYKNANIAIFVFYGKTRLWLSIPCIQALKVAVILHPVGHHFILYLVNVFSIFLEEF